MKRLEGTPVYYYCQEAQGKDWIVFLHAAYVDHSMFSKQFGYFSQKYAIIAPDILGHGQSVKAKKGDGIEKMSDWIAEILNTVGAEKAYFVGVSLGSVLAQDFANKYPDRVLSLACFGGYNINNFDKKWQSGNTKAQIAMALKALISVKLFAKANKKIAAYTESAQNEFYLMNLNFKKSSFRFLAKLNKLVNVYPQVKRRYPLLIGCGEYDVPVEAEIIDKWSQEEPCKTLIFENAGHCVNMDAPAEFCVELEKFWRETQVKR